MQIMFFMCAKKYLSIIIIIIAIVIIIVIIQYIFITRDFCYLLSNL